MDTPCLPPDSSELPTLAQYRTPEIPQYQGNPLIEALPPIFTKQEVANRLRILPGVSEEHRHLSPEIRGHLLQTIRTLFIPLSIHLDLEQRLSRMIRMGYEARNPLDPQQCGRIRSQLESLAPDRRISSNPAGASLGFSLIGMSGVGKTTALNRLLALYPQLIDHRDYAQHPMTMRQLVWAKLECPFDGSVKGLCLNFLQYVDDRLGTMYGTNYRPHRRTVDDLLPIMARVASLHHLGILVIDEMQHLSEAKSGGASRMLNFFVQLINTIGLPVILVGTYKALPIVSGEFRQMRRACGQGDGLWPPMANDETWKYFLEALWTYQYVKQPCPLTDQFTTLFYEETQGITDLAVNLFILAQQRAISTGRERLTANVVRSVARDSFRLMAPVLTALRTRDYQALSHMEDVCVPKSYSPHLSFQTETPSSQMGAEQTALQRSSPSAPPSSVSTRASVSAIPHETPPALGSPPPPIHKIVQQQPISPLTKGPRQSSKGTQISRQARDIPSGSAIQQAVPNEDMPHLSQLIAPLHQAQENAYDSLKRQGIICPLDDDLLGSSLP
ncbi:MAG: ATP-binding protein [Nitrospira sp.]|nr:ATP-binding protein [Nitrospira sp.]